MRGVLSGRGFGRGRVSFLGTVLSQGPTPDLVPLEETVTGQYYPRSKPTFWDVAIVVESDPLEETQGREAILEQGVPSGLFDVGDGVPNSF